VDPKFKAALADKQRQREADFLKKSLGDDTSTLAQVPEELAATVHKHPPSQAGSSRRSITPIEAAQIAGAWESELDDETWATPERIPLSAMPEDGDADTALQKFLEVASADQPHSSMLQKDEEGGPTTHHAMPKMRSVDDWAHHATKTHGSTGRREMPPPTKNIGRMDSSIESAVNPGQSLSGVEGGKRIIQEVSQRESQRELNQLLTDNQPGMKSGTRAQLRTPEFVQGMGFKNDQLLELPSAQRVGTPPFQGNRHSPLPPISPVKKK